LGLNNVGSLMNNRGDYIAALEYLQRAEALTPVEAPLYRRATVAGNLGNVLTKLGRLAEATDYLREAMSLVWRSGDRERECWLGGRLALLYWRRGEHDRALMMAHHSYAAAHALGGAWEQAQLAELLVMFYCQSNDGPPALAWARRADEVATAYGLWRYRLRSRMRLAQAHLLLDQPVQAKESAAQAVALFRENEQPLEEEPELFWTWSQSAAVNGERAMAATAHGWAQCALQRIAQRIPQPDWRESYLTAEPLYRIWPAFNGRRCFSPLSAL
jgi:tetratricopeptide (TPR) repeat protein